jgi:hypothetical protein
MGRKSTIIGFAAWLSWAGGGGTKQTTQKQRRESRIFSNSWRKGGAVVDEGYMACFLPSSSPVTFFITGYLLPRW